MNAPYDGERDRAASYDDATAAGPPPPPEPRSAPDAYPQQQPYAPADRVRPARPRGPCPEPYAPDPYERRQPPPDPRAFHQPAQHYGSEPYASQPYQPADPGGGPNWNPDPGGSQGDQDDDPFAHLFQDQRSAGIGPEQGYAYPDFTDAPPTSRHRNRHPPHPAGAGPANLLKSSAVMAAGTLVSRSPASCATWWSAGAIGVATLNDSYQVANTLPTMIYILVGGGALNAVFIPQLVRSMKNDEDGGEAYANRLLTLVVVGLAAVTTVMVLGAPHPGPADVAGAGRQPGDAARRRSTFTRYCLPTIFFMGVHVVLGQILNARGRFGAMMWTPVLNNIVIISTFGVFIWVYGLRPQLRRRRRPPSRPRASGCSASARCSA